MEFSGVCGIFGALEYLDLHGVIFLNTLFFRNLDSHIISFLLVFIWIFVELWHCLDMSPCNMCLKPPRNVGHWRGTIYLYTYICMHTSASHRERRKPFRLRLRRRRPFEQSW